MAKDQVSHVPICCHLLTSPLLHEFMGDQYMQYHTCWDRPIQILSPAESSWQFFVPLQTPGNHSACYGCLTSVGVIREMSIVGGVHSWITARHGDEKSRWSTGHCAWKWRKSVLSCLCKNINDQSINESILTNENMTLDIVLLLHSILLAILSVLTSNQLYQSTLGAVIHNHMLPTE